MSLINVEGLTHGFADKFVFKNVQFRLLKNEHVGLVGPNGAGKSTLIKIMTGQLLPDEGKIEWNPKIHAGHLEQHIELQEKVTIKGFLKEAFQEHFDKERQWLTLGEQMATATPDEMERLFDQYGRLQEWLEQNDFYSIDAKIDNVADGLGLMQLGMETDVSKLSGGQRTKLLLAKLLLQQPDVLLLDEPTNYLDTGHIEWLTDYLKGYENAFLLISHDTDFMNEVVNIIYHLEHQTLTRYVGNYQSFLKQREMKEQQLQEAFNKQQKEINKLETYISKNKARASTAKQAKSREKKLQKIERIHQPTKLPRPRFKFPLGSEPVRMVFEGEEVSVGYDRPLFPTVNLKLERGEKIAIVGHNGIGKSTLLKTILGEIPPLNGNVSIGDRVKPAYFEQEVHLPNMTALDYVWEKFPEHDQKDIRAALARCGLLDVHLRQPLSSLSGGEQTKVRLCEWTLTKTNWFILDEPTNHLDVDAKDALKEALMAYKGTVLVVSHEKAFVEDWVTGVWDVEDWVQ
ncbi:ATPase subunit of ABC transporter with duplicated ATPase domains [Pullulanibacillus pueri]|uniref:ABC transporter ATP-binding protein n=1 Tax=Pullulanibacillus pueri TaxID=1437324 RepID=A0A8J3EKZ2_9BACL|nr:ABC-F family ATP-binding cassette domain-containing protein [Pullulanibacillus pueri]MBM7681186.1 ATPase subunit of ABC transporter with duplicated ATPase domains [Pullulanibacillus pueri]GGH77385.1 ABC transporter ATP-binding protein [Pullulanibacillus pueri]